MRASIDPGSTNTLIIATSLSGVDGTLHRLLLIELFVTLAVLAGIVVLGLWIVRLGLRPLDAIGRTADAIAGGDLSHRVERAEPHTEVGRLGLALNSMLDRIEASDRRLRRFVADASHELRTPLAAVRAYAELFERGADKRPDDLARAMSGISRESERMSELVEDLLLLARLDEGQPLEREPVELAELAAEAVETARAVDPSRPIDLEVEPARVLGDRARLRRVLDNLLGNVRSHTPAGTPAHVRVRTANGSAVIEVSDEGPGLPEGELDNVFGRFYRADASRSRDSGGVGLGLSIVAAIAQAHDGTVSAGAAARRRRDLHGHRSQSTPSSVLSRTHRRGAEAELVNSAKGERMTTETLVHAVRDGIARTIAVVGLAGVALIHLLDLPGKFQETPYLGWLYVALDRRLPRGRRGTRPLERSACMDRSCAAAARGDRRLHAHTHGRPAAGDGRHRQLERAARHGLALRRRLARRAFGRGAHGRLEACGASPGERMSGKLLIVVPAVNSRFRHWLSDEDDARRAAEDRLRICVERFQRAGFRVEGHVGDRDIVQAIGDALALVDADAVVVATPSSEDRIPLEYARDCFALPIVHVVIDPEVLHAAA